MKVRLQKYMADSGVASRRASEAIIAEGRVAVNGHVVSRPGVQIDPDVDVVRVDQVVIKPRRKLYVALHKPKGYVSTRSDERSRRILADLLPKEWKALYPVGRLDRDSEGLILLTNDGEFCLRVSHPRYGILKTYEVLIEGRVDKWHVDAMLKGIRDKGEFLKCREAKILTANNSHSIVEMVLSEGRNREVRRLFASQSLKVERLIRTSVGPIQLGELPSGKWRTLNETEIAALTEGQAAPARSRRH